jgi:hypothetical protein
MNKYIVQQTAHSKLQNNDNLIVNFYWIISLKISQHQNIFLVKVGRILYLYH